MDSGGLLLGEMTRTRCYHYSVMRDGRENTRRDRRRGFMQGDEGQSYCKARIGIEIRIN